MSKGYIDFKLAELYPNKHALRPEDIRRFKVLDWDKLKEVTWKNNVMKNGEWWCHLEGSQGGGLYGDEDEFWIGFDAASDRVDYHFTSGEGMCHYTFSEFYDSSQIENKWDMAVQVNAIKFLNRLIDE